jgi:hypothetical protein
LQTFDRAKLVKVLSAHFTLLKVKELQFTTWDCLNWKGRMIAGMRRILQLLGVHGSNENFLFVCRKDGIATLINRQSASFGDR